MLMIPLIILCVAIAYWVVWTEVNKGNVSETDGISCWCFFSMSFVVVLFLIMFMLRVFTTTDFFKDKIIEKVVKQTNISDEIKQENIYKLYTYGSNDSTGDAQFNRYIQKEQSQTDALSTYYYLTKYEDSTGKELFKENKISSDDISFSWIGEKEQPYIHVTTEHLNKEYIQSYKNIEFNIFQKLIWYFFYWNKPDKPEDKVLHVESFTHQKVIFYVPENF